MVTIYKVAEKAKTSPGTVSKALSNRGYVAEETKRNIEKIARKLNYTPNLRAQSLKTKKTYTLGLLIPDISNPFYSAVTKGIYNKAREEGYHLILGNSYGDPQEELNILKMFHASQIDGLILMAAEVEKDKNCFQYLSELVGSGLPVVLCDRKTDHLLVDQVRIDSFKGAYLATHHLVDLGHNRIGFINGSSKVLVGLECLRGYQKALIEHHILVDKNLILEEGFNKEGGYKCMQKFLKIRERPSAIFAANDVIALGAILAIREAKLKIPEEIAIVGFDDIELASVVSPRLTTIAQPKEEGGRIAASLLLQRINKTGPREPQKILLEPRLVVRESTISVRR